MALLAAAEVGLGEVLLGREQVLAVPIGRRRVRPDRPLRVVLEAAGVVGGLALREPAAPVRDRVQRRRRTRLPGKRVAVRPSVQ